VAPFTVVSPVLFRRMVSAWNVLLLKVVLLSFARETTLAKHVFFRYFDKAVKQQIKRLTIN
jgi:hypothetical protein